MVNSPNGSIYKFAVGTVGGLVNIYLGIRYQNKLSYFRYNTIQPTNSDISALSFSSTGRYLAIGTSSGEIFIYDLDNNNYINLKNRYSIDSKVKEINWHPNQDIFVAAQANYVKAFLINNTTFLHNADLQMVKIISKTSNIEVNSVSFSPNGNYIAVGGGDNHVRIYKFLLYYSDNPETYDTPKLDYLLQLNSPISKLTFAGGANKENNYYLLVGQEGLTLYVLSVNPADGSLIRKDYTIISEEDISSLAFSPDGVNIGLSHHLNIQLPVHSSGVFSLNNLDEFGSGFTYNYIIDSNCLFDGYSSNAVAFSPDGWYFFIGGGNGKLGIFEYKFK